MVDWTAEMRDPLHAKFNKSSLWPFQNIKSVLYMITNDNKTLHDGDWSPQSQLSPEYNNVNVGLDLATTAAQ